MELAVAIAALIVAIIACLWAWSLHARIRELETESEDRADEHFRRTSLLCD